MFCVILELKIFIKYNAAFELQISISGIYMLILIIFRFLNFQIFHLSFGIRPSARSISSNLLIELWLNYTHKMFLSFVRLNVL